VPTPTCFDTKVPSSGYSSVTKILSPIYIFGTIHSHFHNKSWVNWSFQHFKVVNFHDGIVNTIYIPQTLL
jgi:hypothetical protein